MRAEQLAVYIHIPFCARKCFYCDFSSRPNDFDDRQMYLRAVRKEILGSPYRGAWLKSLFFGGGTPTELTGDEIESLVDTLTAVFSFEVESEWTIECNPGTVSPACFHRLFDLGFNRISLGVQSFQDKYLQTLGRIHCVGDVFETFRWIRRSGFDNVNLDLMYGVPGQTLDEWEADLREATNLAPEHLSLYNLTLESGTRFEELLNRGKLQSTEEETLAQMYEIALDLTEQAGYRQYEISNFCLPGFECVHNLAYWKNEDYLGFGISAASFMSGTRWTNTNDWNSYLRGATDGDVPRGSEEHLHGELALAEEIMLRIRTRDGFCAETLSRKHGVDFDRRFSESVGYLVSVGLIECKGSRLRLTRRGKLLANEVCAEFLRKAQLLQRERDSGMREDSETREG